MGFTKEELLENLPDYINNKLDNKKLEEAIRVEISTNPDFKNEYDLLSSTHRSIKKVEFTEPPGNYFNNLLPSIYDRIYKKQRKFDFVWHISKLWKYAVPVAAIILFFIGYKTIFKNNEYINNLNNDSQIVLKELNYSDEKKIDTSIKSERDINSEYTDGSDNLSQENKEYIKPKHNLEKANIKEKEETNNQFLDLDENSFDDVFFIDDDESNFEQDFEKMSTEEQNNIILKIKNSNL